VEAQVYDAVGVICTAAATIRGTLTGATLKVALDNSGTFNGVTGTIKFDQHDDVVKPIRLRIIQHEQFVNLERRRVQLFLNVAASFSLVFSFSAAFFFQYRTFRFFDLSLAAIFIAGAYPFAVVIHTGQHEIVGILLL
jgi:hypothetical protein